MPKSDLWVIFVILSTVIGYCAKIYLMFQANMTAYQNLITKSMYDKQLDSGRGTLLHLCDDVVQQEVKEVIISYFILMEQGKATLEDLDMRCDGLIKEEFGVSCNFDVDDAVIKLEKLGIISQDCTEQIKCEKLGPSSSFARMIYAEIEEVGWEHLLRLGDDLMCLSFHVRDKKGRVHVMEIMLDETYPKCPPSISADVPYILTLEWLINYRLKNVVKQFQEHLEKLQEFWTTLDVIDHDLWVVYPKPPSRATCYRQINMGDDCFLMLFINATDPQSLPECRFTGSDQKVNLLTKVWRRNCKRWMKDKPLPENLANIFELKLPGPPSVHMNDQQTECGICYAQYLPTDVELGARSGSATDYTCDNKVCNRAFHSICLGDWLLTLTTTRQSFDVLFGNCPYCSDPVAIKVNVKK